jgi:hypothetical protein
MNEFSVAHNGPTGWPSKKGNALSTCQKNVELPCEPEKSPPEACAWQKDAYVLSPNSKRWFYRTQRFLPHLFVATPDRVAVYELHSGWS